MPVSPADGEDLARAVAELYEDAEIALLEILAKALRQGIESPLWAELKLRSIGDVRAAVEEVTQALQTDATGAIGRALAEAYARGDQAAVAELGALPEGLRHAAARHLPNARAVDRMAADLINEQRPVYLRILRAVPDAYRSIVARASSSTLLGGLTRRQASQRALDQFAAHGITGFTDSAGRNWQMASYAEMAVRSATGRAAIAGHIDRLEALGQQLVTVSAAPLECPLCRPWEGEILAINGQTGPHTLRLQHATEARQSVVVHIAGSLPEARAAGLFHPNCRHSLSLYLPGVTTRPQSPPHPQGATYEDTQQQRYLERQVRAWKRKSAVAMDDQARRKAQARVREYQGRIRELTADKGLRRKPEREQVPTARTPDVRSADRNEPGGPDSQDEGKAPPNQRAARPGDLVTGIDTSTPHGAAMQHTIDIIDRVHSMPPGMRPIPLASEHRPGYQGAYRGTEITLNPDGQAPYLTAAHELGHFLDHAGLGPRGRDFGTDTAIQPGGYLHAWWQAVEDSAVAGMLQYIRNAFPDGSAMVDRIRPDGTRYTVDVDYRHIDYLLSHREMFGRAYAQWIAVRSGDPQLLADLEVARDPANGETVITGTGILPGYPRYWSDEDFEPIAAELDRAFRRLNLLRGG